MLCKKHVSQLAYKTATNSDAMTITQYFVVKKRTFWKYLADQEAQVAGSYRNKLFQQNELFCGMIQDEY